MKTNWHLCPDDNMLTYCPNEIDVQNIPDYPWEWWNGKECLICSYFDYQRELKFNTPKEEKETKSFDLASELKSLTKYVKRIQKNAAKKYGSKNNIGSSSSINSKLKVFTARIDSVDPDRLNITRKSGKPYGRCFAPSWELINRFKVKQESKNEKKDQIVEFGAYAIAYIEEMKASYVSENSSWTNLLLSNRVVLTCYCTDHEKCHRTVLARDILPNYGAEYCGEIKSDSSDSSNVSDFHDSEKSGKSKKTKKTNNGQGSLF